MTEDLNDLAAFAVVAEARSFTKGAAQLNISPSALSQTIGKLEKRLGVRLLARTTRSVALTEAGERLFNVVQPRVSEIDVELTALKSLRDKPSGTIRITTSEHPALTILEPALVRLMSDYPDITVEVSIDYGLTDIVAERFDAGIRLGEHLAQDMIAVPISPPLRMAVVGSPAYFARHPVPLTPDDLHVHRCINIRFPRLGNLAQWEFEKEGRAVNVKVNAVLVNNSMHLGLAAALDGIGLAWTGADLVRRHVEAGTLVQVLEDWCPAFPGYHLYFPSRVHPSSAFSVLVDALRYRPDR
ncbi:LysR family transcriptional regulator [Pseudorhodobacter sp.]|uniref:LysR family transcriptional regulator n=1 Tax=Pseudorhodobacter sp. TaxID=1934400 RepID=UPI00264908C3|nr:LysR family transcriptional regulator [Pseudorhodobacter sp.]MDN5785879.1 LysR family transcriptional regulator [Pseudorhodobacter sp.]